MIDPTVYARTRNMPASSSTAEIASIPAPATPAMLPPVAPVAAAQPMPDLPDAPGRLRVVRFNHKGVSHVRDVADLRSRYAAPLMPAPVKKPRQVDEIGCALSPAESRGLSPAEQQIAQCLGRDITGPRSRKVLF